MMCTLWPLGVGQVYRSIKLILRIDDDGARDLIVPALLAAVDRSPHEAEIQGKRRHEVADKAQREPSESRRLASLRIHDLHAERDLSRRRAAVAPEADD